MRPLTSVDQAIAVLGGPSVVARWLGVDLQHVAVMKHRGRFPRAFILHVYLSLRERGYDPAPNILGLETLDSIMLPLGDKKKRSATRNAQRTSVSPRER